MVRCLVTPPAAKAAAPNPVGTVRGITGLFPLTQTAPREKRSSRIGLTPPKDRQFCQVGVTWKGRNTVKRRSDCLSCAVFTMR